MPDHNLCGRTLCRRDNTIVTGRHVVVTWGMALTATRTARSERDRILTALRADLEELAERAVARMPTNPGLPHPRPHVLRRRPGPGRPALPDQDGRARAPAGDPAGPGLRPALRAAPGPGRDRAGRLPARVTPDRPAGVLGGGAGAAGDSPAGHEAALELATEVMRYSDIACTHASRAYVEYQQHLVADADRERRDLLEHLLAGELPTHRPLLAAAQAHGLTERTPALVAGAMPVTADADAPHVAAEALARADGPTGRALVVRRRGELVVVAALRPADPAADAADVCDRLQETQRRLRIGGVPLAVGVGTVASGIAELPGRTRRRARRWPTSGWTAG